MAQLRGSPGTMALAVYGTFATKGMQWMWNFGGVEISGVLGRRLSRAGDPGVGGRDVDREMVPRVSSWPTLRGFEPWRQSCVISPWETGGFLLGPMTCRSCKLLRATAFPGGKPGSVRPSCRRLQTVSEAHSPIHRAHFVVAHSSALTAAGPLDCTSLAVAHVVFPMFIADTDRAYENASTAGKRQEIR